MTPRQAVVAHAFHHNTLEAEKSLEFKASKVYKGQPGLLAYRVLNTNKNSVNSFLYYQIIKVDTAERKSPYISTLIAGVLFPFSLFLFLFKFFNAFFQNIGPEITFKIG